MSTFLLFLICATVWCWVGRKVCQWVVNVSGYPMSDVEGAVLPIVWPIVGLIGLKERFKFDTSIKVQRRK